MKTQRPPRIAFYLDDESRQALNELKAYYGTQSTPIVARRAIVEHAKQIKAPVRRSKSCE
jgi:hypothetical protein